MGYEIIRAATPAPVHYARSKSIERLTMEELEVGDAFMVHDYDAHLRCVYARAEMKPKKFSVRKVPSKGWQVRRVE